MNLQSLKWIAAYHIITILYIPVILIAWAVKCAFESYATIKLYLKLHNALYL